MYLHEYQAKQLFSTYGIPVLPHHVVESEAELEAYVTQNRLQEAVLKVQVHSGGRGKAGGIIYAKSPPDIVQAGKRLIGMKIITAQTGPEGIIAHKVLIDTPVSFIQESYFLPSVSPLKVPLQ